MSDPMKGLPEWYQIVTRPFPFREIEIMAQAVSKDKDSALAICYLDARAVMNRLDEAFGPENWSATYAPITVGNHAGILCTLIGKDDDGNLLVQRQDGSDPTDIESFKGAISDSLKRTFAALGHRLLYNVELSWQPCVKNSQGKFSKWTDAAYANMKKAYEAQVGLGSTFPKAPEPLPEATHEELESKTKQAKDDHDRKAVALTFLRRIGMLDRGDNDRPYPDAKDIFTGIKTSCKDKKLIFDEVVCNAMTEGVLTPEQLVEYVNGL